MTVRQEFTNLWVKYCRKQLKRKRDGKQEDYSFKGFMDYMAEVEIKDYLYQEKKNIDH